LQELHFASRRIAEGDFSQRLPVIGNDELADTAIAFNTMAARLETQVERMRLDSARRESIETELRVAREIQASLHPAACPLFPGFPPVEVEAIDDPVKEIGGDFYDWFAVDEHRLGIVIADVAGKGVPAGLFAAACLTVIRTLARTGIAPEEVLSRANEQLLEQNREQMFASLVLLHLDVRTGEISAAVAGHPAGRIIRVGGALEHALARTGPILGVITGAKWERTTCTLNIGDRLVLLTDGAFEARDAKGTMLQDEGVDQLLENLPHATAARTARHIAWAVRRREGENPGDDLTVLVMRRLDEKKPD
jgi:sigma-B regulation protein RsbU (phosphoserine phosphatase)